MSTLARGFVRDSRFGAGQVIAGTNRETTRKWRALGVPTYVGGFVKPATCEACGAECCDCDHCQTVKPSGRCWGCRA